MVHGDLGYDTLARKPAEEDTKHAVIAAYTNALRGPEDMRPSAFDVALRAYRMRHPSISEGITRRRVAQLPPLLRVSDMDEAVTNALTPDLRATSRMLTRSSPPSSIRARLACSTFWRRSVVFCLAGNFLPAPLDTVKSLAQF